MGGVEGEPPDGGGLLAPNLVQPRGCPPARGRVMAGGCNHAGAMTSWLVCGEVGTHPMWTEGAYLRECGLMMRTYVNVD